MKAAKQFRTQIKFRVLLVASIIALGVCLNERSVVLAAADASPASAKESSEKKDKDAGNESKKDTTDSSASKSTDGKPDHNDSAKSARSADSKSKKTTTKHESEKSSKGEKVRLAMLTLKDSLPESAEHSSLFSENKLDMRE